MIFGVISDLHFHNWSSFATTDSMGLNTRLAILLREVERAAETVKSKGGETLVIAGDVFHVRGSVAPSVLNPVRDLLTYITRKMGLYVYIIAGNHDLEGKHSNRLGSAVTALQMEFVTTVSDSPIIIANAKTMLVPWIEDVEALKEVLQNARSQVTHVIMHAPLNGVIKGLPDNGIDPAWIGGLNKFKLVLSGHYHNHKVYYEGQTHVVSIGAIAHHTWSDVGSKAGFLIVDSDDGTVEFHASHAPRFVDLDSDMSPADMALEADGNYVRARVLSSELKELAEVREALTAAGAAGVTLIPEPTRQTASRAATSVKTGTTLLESVESFIDNSDFDHKEKVKKLAESFLNGGV